MNELSVDRFRFRLVRRGWAHGEATRRVLAAAKGRIPSAIAARLAETSPAGDYMITEPVRIRLRARLSELAAACTSDDALAALVARWLPAPLEETARVATVSEPTMVADERRVPFGAVLGEPGDPAVTPRDAVEVVLRAWHARGDLARLLAGFDETALELWERALLASLPVRSTISPSRAVELAARVVAELPAPLPVERAARLRLRIQTAVASLARAIDPIDVDELVKALDAAVPLPSSSATRPTPALGRVGAATATRPVMPSVAARSRRGASSPRAGEVSIASALPFLLLRPLHRLGYLDTLAASFTAAARPHELPAFAAALAYKVLAPPTRGWSRPAPVEAVAAAFAGLDEPPTAAAMTALAECAATTCSPLDTLIETSLVAGRDHTRPLLLAAAAGERALLDVDGLFVLAWGDRAVTLAPDALLLVPADAADPALLADLDARGCRFVTDAPPTRGETLRRLSGARLWTNDHTESAESLARVAAHLDAADEARGLVEALAIRRAVPRGTAVALERSLTLAAAGALGDLAYTLWRDREPPSPRLALERFADLSARVRFHDASVEVLLPLGARHRDLQRHGYLGDFKVPWLDRPIRTRGA